MTDYNPNDLNAVLARIEANQIEQGKKLDAALIKLDKQDERIAYLEKWKYWLMGGAATLGATGAELWDKIKGAFSTKL